MHHRTPTSERVALVLGLAPLPMVAALAYYDWSDIVASARASPVLAGAVLALGGAVLVSTIVARKPQHLIERGSALWILLGVSGVLLHLFGSVYGAVPLHLFGLAVLYLGVAGYLGGWRFGRYLATPAVAFSAIGLVPYARGFWGDVAGVPLLLGVGILMVGASRRTRKVSSDCGQCQTYRGRGYQFCRFCGRILAKTVILSLPLKRLIGVVVMTVVVFAFVSAISIPVTTLTQRGLETTSYGFAGVTGVVRFPTAPGWSASLVSTVPSQVAPTFYYSLKGRATANGTFVLGPTVVRTVESALGNRTVFNNVAPVKLEGGQVGIRYSWSENHLNYTGTLLTSQITYLQDGQFKRSIASFFFTTQAGSSDYFLANYTSVILPTSPSTNFVMSAMVLPALTNFQYLELVMGFAFFGAFAAVARAHDSASERLFENSASMTTDESRVLALIESDGGRWTGKGLLERLGAPQEWSELNATLEKFVTQGAVNREIIIKDGAPMGVWSCRLPP